MHISTNKRINFKTPTIVSCLIATFMLFSNFTGNAQCTDFDLSLWTANQFPVSHDGVVNEAGAPGSISLTGANDFSGVFTEMNYCITITTPGTISFDWAYQSANSAAGFDPFAYLLNGFAIQLTNGAIGTFNGA